MRFSNRFSLKPQEGKQRIKRKFLLIPRTFESEQTRWLEYANIVEEVKSVRKFTFKKNRYLKKWKWIEVGFADEIANITEHRKIKRRDNIDFENDNDGFSEEKYRNKLLNSAPFDCNILSQDDVDGILNMFDI